MHDSHTKVGHSPVRRGAVAVAALALPLAVAGFAAAPAMADGARRRHGRDRLCSSWNSRRCRR